MDRPNIVFIMSDDHAAHAMSCYGSRINQTPHLDRIRRRHALRENDDIPLIVHINPAYNGAQPDESPPPLW